MKNRKMMCICAIIIMTFPLFCFQTLKAEAPEGWSKDFTDTTITNTPSSNNYGLQSNGVYELQDAKNTDANGHPVTLIIDSHDIYRLADAIDKAILICK